MNQTFLQESLIYFLFICLCVHVCVLLAVIPAFVCMPIVWCSGHFEAVGATLLMGGDSIGGRVEEIWMERCRA